MGKTLRIWTIYHWSEWETNALHKIIHPFQKGTKENFFPAAMKGMSIFLLPFLFHCRWIPGHLLIPQTAGCLRYSSSPDILRVQYTRWQQFEAAYSMQGGWYSLAAQAAWYSLIRVAKETGGWLMIADNSPFKDFTQRRGGKVRLKQKRTQISRCIEKVSLHLCIALTQLST